MIHKPRATIDRHWLTRIVSDGGEVGPMVKVGKGWGHGEEWRLRDGQRVPETVVDRLFDQGFIEPSRTGFGTSQGFRVVAVKTLSEKDTP